MDRRFEDLGAVNYLADTGASRVRVAWGAISRHRSDLRRDYALSLPHPHAVQLYGTFV